MTARPDGSPGAARDTREMRDALGERTAFDDLYARVYHTLREIAHHRLRSHRAGATLGTTALVHEAYLRLVDHAVVSPSDRAHLLALASRAMRFVLVDRARERTAQKRGGDAAVVPLDTVQVAADERALDLLALADALERLAAVSPRLAEIVDYRFFGGLTFDEIAEATGMSVPTAKRDWARARAWLYRLMQVDPGPDA